MAKVRGNSRLNFTGGFDIQEILSNQQKVIQGFNDMKKAAETSTGGNGGSSNLRQQNLATQQALRDSRLELERLKQEEQSLINQQAQLGVSTADLTRRFQANRVAQQELRIATQAARTSQQAANGSYREAQQRLTALGHEIRGAVGGFNNLGAAQRARIAEYRQLNASLTEFDRRLGNNQRNVGNYSNALNGIGSNLAGLAAGYFSAFAALSAVSKVIRTNAELSDSFADVQRTAGLTGTEVDNLSEQLKKIDTRTSLKGLFDIAIVGGQLGIAKDQLAGFTKAVDELAVTLSGELKGGAEGIAKSLGVLDNVFKVTANNSGDVEKSYNQIGSAILKLGQSGLATGDFLADFGERVGGVAKQAGISLPVILSYGAVLQENGVSAEVAGTAFKRLISALASNSGKFFQVAKFADANLTLKDFNRIVNTDTNKALELFFAGINKGGSSTIAFNSILKSLKISGAGASQVVSALSNNTQALEGHVKEATKAFDEATLSGEQFAIKNDTLAGSIDKLGKAFENSTNSGAVAGFFKPIIDFITEGIKGLDLLASKLKGTQSDADDKLVAANRGKFNIASDDPKERAELEAARDRVRKRNIDALKDEVKAVGASTADIIASGKSEIELRKLITGEIYKQGEAQKRLNNNLKFITDPKNVGAPLDAQIAKTNKLRIAYAKQIAVVEQLKSKLPKAEVSARSNAEAPNLKDDKKTESRLQSDLNARNELQRKIDEINKNAVRKQISADDAEVESVSDKYRKIEFEIEKFNRRNKSGLKLTTSSLSASEQKEVEEVRAKQSIEISKRTFEEQKILFKEYEDYRLQVGEKTSRERFKNDIGSYDNYVAYLKAQLPKENDISVEANKRRDLINKELLPKAQKEQLKQQQDLYTKLLADTLSFDEARSNLILRGEENAALLRKNGQEKQAQQLEANNKLQLQYFDEGYKESIPALRRLYEGIDDLSNKSALNVINDSRNQLDALLLNKKISTEVYEQILKLINQSERSVKNRWIGGLNDVASQINGIASEVGDVNEGFGKMLNTLGSVLGQVSNIGKGIDAFKTAQKSNDVLGSIGAGLGIVGAGISIFKTVFSLFDRSKQREEQAVYAQELQNKQTESLNKALERQISLLDKVYGTERIKNYDAAIKEAQSNEQKYLNDLNNKFVLTGDKTKDDFIKELNATGTINQLQFFGDRAVKEFRDTLTSLPTGLKELQKLLDEGKLDSNTAVIVQNLIKANETAIELGNNLRRELTGTSIDQLADDFISTLTDGTQNFGETFEETIRKSIINGFKGELIKDQLQAFYEDFAKLSKEGLTEDEINILRDSYVKAGEEQKKKLEELSKITGIDLTGGSEKTKANTLQGSIRASLTEETGSILARAFNGMRLSLLNIEGVLRPMAATQINIANLAQQNLNQAMQIQLNTFRTANNTDTLSYRLERMEELTGMVAKNTGDTLSVQLRAAGKFSY